MGIVALTLSNVDYSESLYELVVARTAESCSCPFLPPHVARISWEIERHWVEPWWFESLQRCLLGGRRITISRSSFSRRCRRLFILFDWFCVEERQMDLSYQRSRISCDLCRNQYIFVLHSLFHYLLLIFHIAPVAAATIIWLTCHPGQVFVCGWLGHHRSSYPRMPSRHLLSWGVGLVDGAIDYRRRRRRDHHHANCKWICFPVKFQRRWSWQVQVRD